LHFKQLVCASALALAAATFAPAALAQTCAGFTDVPDDGTAPGAFCPNVEWLKNRAITLGCTSTTLYCPNQNVTRLQMAAFMNRLGTALTPTFLRRKQDGTQLGALNYSGVQTLCETGAPPAVPATPFDVVGYPRSAIVTGLLNVFTPNGPFDLEAKLVYSTNNGASWLPSPAGDGFAYGSLYQSVPGTGTLFAPPFDISLRPYAFFDLEVGQNYRFAIQGLRKAGTGDTATSYCELHVQIVNRNGATSPRDVEGVTFGRGF
jgi:hypothetical protein